MSDALLFQLVLTWREERRSTWRPSKGPYLKYVFRGMLFVKIAF
jgi:hypothetical protein